MRAYGILARAYKIPVRVYKTQVRAYTKVVNLFSEDRELPDDKFDGHHGHHSSLGRHVDLSHHLATLRTSRLSQRRSEMRKPVARASCPKIRLTNALGFVVPSVRLRQGVANAPATDSHSATRAGSRAGHVSIEQSKAAALRWEKYLSKRALYSERVWVPDGSGAGAGAQV